MKKPTALLLAALLLLTPAAAAEPEGAAAFADVQDTDWFAPYVDVCAQEGIMLGTGEGTFSPGRTLTFGEIFTMAARVAAMAHGLEAIPALPEDYDSLVTFRDGEGNPVGTLADAEEWFSLPLDDPLILRRPDWAEEGWSQGTAITFSPAFLEKVGTDGPLTLEFDPAFITWEGKPVSLTGYRLSYLQWTVAGEELQEVFWFPALGEFDLFDALTRVSGMNGDVAMVEAEMGREWFSDSVYYLDLVVQGDIYLRAPRFQWPMTMAELGATPAWREDFVFLLSITTGELEKINDISSLPDVLEEFYDPEQLQAIYNYYGAGILTGADKYGTFAGDRTLTRAEAAAMTARILRPELRLTFTPEDYAPFAAAHLTPATVLFDNGITAEAFLPWVNARIAQAEEAAAGEGKPFNWHDSLPGSDKTYLEWVKAQVLEDLGVEAGQGLDAYKNFDVQVYYSRLIDLTGKTLEPGYAVKPGGLS